MYNRLYTRHMLQRRLKYTGLESLDETGKRRNYWTLASEEEKQLPTPEKLKQGQVVYKIIVKFKLLYQTTSHD